MSELLNYPGFSIEKHDDGSATLSHVDAGLNGAVHYRVGAALEYVMLGRRPAKGTERKFHKLLMKADAALKEMYHAAGVELKKEKQ
jgi:hypothetical protein